MKDRPARAPLPRRDPRWLAALVATGLSIGAADRATRGASADGDAPAMGAPAPEDPDLRRAADAGKEVDRLHDAGKFAEALALAREALAIRERILGPEDPATARSLVAVGGVLKTLGEHEAARPLFERALVVQERILGPEHADTAKTVNFLGVLDYETGRYEAARPLFERALATNQKVLGPENVYTAQSLNNLAALLQAMGRHGDARPLFERALAIREKAAPEHPYTAHSLSNLALLLQNLGQHETARPLLERALAIVEKVLGPAHPDTAVILNNLGRLRFEMGERDAAQPLYERALSIVEKALGPNHPELVAVLDTLATLLQAAGRYGDAKPLRERALAVAEKAFGPEHPLTARCLNEVGKLLQAMGQDAAALPFHRRALAIDEKSLGPEHQDTATLLLETGRVLMRLGNQEEGRALFTRSLDRTVAIAGRWAVGLQGPQRVALARTFRVRLGVWLRALDRLGGTGYPEVLEFKGLMTRIETAERLLAREAGGAVKERVEALRAADRVVSSLTNSVPPERAVEKRKAWQERYAAAGAERDRLALSLSRDFAGFRRGLGRLDLRQDDVRAALAPDAALVDFLSSGGRYLAWIVRREGEIERIDVGKAEEIEALAKDFAERTASEDTKADDPAWVEAGRALAAKVLGPFSKRLGTDVRTLYVCPDSVLAAVPFAALPGREPGRILADDVTVVNLAMAQDLVPWKDEPAPGKGALLLGGIDYESEARVAPGPDRERSVDPAAAMVLASRGSRAARGHKFLPIPATLAEVRDLGRLLGEGVEIVEGPLASEARLRARVVGKRVVHLATHGYVDDDERLWRAIRPPPGAEGAWRGGLAELRLAGVDPMLLAGFALAGANERRGGGDDDGVVTAVEASTLDLRGVDLVVLSACRTALGRSESGEGVLGLVQGFQMAGARHVVASLWDVDDEATRLLMGRFYEGILRRENPLSVGEALREASRALRTTKVEGHDFTAPRYWAGFLGYARGTR